ncbi:uncharacterized protein [Watersipora subatra]|uniref:uncharacterized protein n=1 Tax=Watersipora subatra TaxID=2589382 RepID=UPI00355B0CE1
MDGEKILMSSQKSKFPFQGLALLVLSFLLTGTVGGLIYLSIHGQASCQPQQKVKTVDIEADVTVTSGNNEKEEHISYDQNSRVAYYKGADGSFEVDDFSKGIHIIRAPGNKVCYVIPVGANSNSHQGFESFLKNSNHGAVQVDGSVENEVQILPGKIEDTSFIPDGAHEECTNGYRWMVVTSSASADNGKVKREAEDELDTGCKYCYHFNKDDGSLYESCFVIAEFDFCYRVYLEGDRPDWVVDSHSQNESTIKP